MAMPTSLRKCKGRALGPGPGIVALQVTGYLSSPPPSIGVSRGRGFCITGHRMKPLCQINSINNIVLRVVFQYPGKIGFEIRQMLVIK